MYQQTIETLETQEPMFVRTAYGVVASEGNLTLLGVTPLTLTSPTGRSGSPAT